MIEVCAECGAEVALLHPVSLLKLIRAVGEDYADLWRHCLVCKGWVRGWKVTADA